MISQFEDGKIYIFDMETYLNDSVKNEEDMDIIENYWVQECNQKTVTIINEEQGCIVVNGTLYSIVPKWCKEKSFVIKKMIIEEGDF